MDGGSRGGRVRSLRLYSFFALVVGEVAPKKMAGAVTKACSPAPIIIIIPHLIFCNIFADVRPSVCQSVIT